MERMVSFQRVILSSSFAVIGIFLACQAGVLWLGREITAYPSDAIRPVPVILVLGASVLPNGKPSDILADRLRVAVDLYAAGLGEKVLVSGDNGQDGYDEVNAMRAYLLDAGVEPEDIFLDHAGFDTYDSMYRAIHVFNVSQALVVTQRYHLSRALFIANALGMDARGVSSDLQPYRKQTLFSIRESVARVKAVLDVLRGARPEYLGERIDITGDGRVTWDEGISVP